MVVGAMQEICQHKLPCRPWAEPDLARLPGMRPVAADDWVISDECFARQMAYRDHLLSTKRDAVFAVGPEPVALELRDLVVDTIAERPGYHRDDATVTRPDGVMIDLLGDDPLIVAARLLQEDLCILTEAEGGHVLAGAALCFPASWTLEEKIGKHLIGIHTPVQPYDAALARRVQRLFDALRPGRVLMRANYLTYDKADLHQPRRMGERRDPGVFHYLRVERQTLRRLPRTGAVIFAIHTYVVPRSALSMADQTAIKSPHSA